MKLVKFFLYLIKHLPWRYTGTERVAVYMLVLTWALDEGACYLHALAALPPGKDSLGPTGQEAG